MAEIINFQAGGDNDNKDIFSEDESIHEKEEVSLDSFIDDSAPNGNLSDYYGFNNAARLVSSTEEHAFEESDVKKFLGNNVEVRNYCVNSEDDMQEEEDIFADTSKKIEELKKTFQIPNGNVSEDSFLYAICYATPYDNEKNIF